jgi:hypothetical protein
MSHNELPMECDGGCWFTLASQLLLVGVAAMEFQKGHACEEGKNESFAWAWGKIRNDSLALGPWTFLVLS